MAKRKKPPDYKAILKSLRGKITFNYDLRKRLTTGQKSAIKKAEKTIHRLAKYRLIKPPKHPHETDSHYIKRLTELKRMYAQQGTSAKGVFLDVPEVPFRIKDNIIRVKEEAKRYREIFVPLDIRSFMADPEAYIRLIIRGRRVRTLYPMHTAFRSQGFGLDKIDEFIDKMQDIIVRYRSDRHVLTGFILGIYF